MIFYCDTIHWLKKDNYVFISENKTDNGQENYVSYIGVGRSS